MRGENFTSLVEVWEMLINADVKSSRVSPPRRAPPWAGCFNQEKDPLQQQAAYQPRVPAQRNGPSG